ncbi:5,10-methylene tetrahydromethanopterin reductase [Streptomyces cadmiisoli]|uniref:5,10-methylene tetrahydromethanopterin reductase n=2 Tax=Streptomyces cadmiisoli TaxID=2184053 RepID=A0A2Z4JAT0_9ACTN|nr:5,10-methylene tetrahydromethanopterin reductase [Streptomyces cadmiisoli]
MSHAVRLWQGQAPTSDPHQTFTAAAVSGFRVPAGIGVTLMPFRHPFDAALQARTLSLTLGHPLVVGYGPGTADVQRRLLGEEYTSQLGATRDYLTIVRGLLNDGGIAYKGKHFTCDATLKRVPGPPIELGLGVLRPGMARLAGEIADVAITWMTPASYLADVIVPALDAGATAAGRPRPRLTAIVPVALSGPDRVATQLVLASNAGHLRQPNYAGMLRLSGIDIDMTNPEAGAEALIEGGGFLFGTGEELAHQLDQFRQAGADEIVLNVTGVAAKFGSRVALNDLQTMLADIPQAGSAAAQ